MFKFFTAPCVFDCVFQSFSKVGLEGVEDGFKTATNVVERQISQKFWLHLIIAYS